MFQPNKTTLTVCCFAALIISIATAKIADAHTHRSTAVKHAFQREHPCPSTGKRRGACPGYVKDHIKALACARTPEERKALDVPGNLQWQTVEEAKAKDKRERRQCKR